jgi:protein-S-isoprenylcysteine O-methyltransferase Ste14
LGHHKSSNSGQEEIGVKKEHLVGAIFVLTALIVLGIMFLSRDSLTISSETGKLSGSIIFFLGMAVFLWTSLFLCEAFQGIVTPVTDRLIVIGPYRWIRHPLYLSMIIILLGMGISLRSLW